MGNTSRKTACKPMFLRRLGATSACRNSLYEVVCNSIRLGGAMISLILPKLILSVARDGILTFGDAGNHARLLVFPKTTAGKDARFKSELAETKPLEAAVCCSLM